jgi:hypothetical protein
MITTGKLLSASSIPMETDEELKKETKVFKVADNPLFIEMLPQRDVVHMKYIISNFNPICSLENYRLK